MQPPYPPSYGYPYAPVPSKPTDTSAILSLVFGILSLLCAGLIAGIPAIILGIVSRRRIENTGYGGGGMAIAGLVTGSIGTLGSLIFGGLFLLGTMVAPHEKTAAPARFTFAPLHRSGGPLATQLREGVRKAKAKQLRPYGYIGATWCIPCKEAERSFLATDAAERFHGAYVMKMDADEWDADLGAAGMQSAAVPAFFHLDDVGRPQGRSMAGLGNLAEFLAK